MQGRIRDVLLDQHWVVSHEISTGAHAEDRTELPAERNI